MSFRRTSEPCHSYLPELLPSGANVRKSAVYCQPSDDSDVTDAIRVQRYGPTYNRLYLPASENNIAENGEFPHVAGPAERVFQFPVTFNDSGNDLPIQNTSLCAVNNSCPSDINLHSDQCVNEARNPAYRDNVEDIKGDIYQHDGGGCTVDGRGEEDCPVFGNTPTGSPMDSGQVLALKRNYNKLLEKQHQFVISNARLNDANEELQSRVEDLEKELTDAREEVRILQSEKMQMMHQLLSFKRMMGDRGPQKFQQETGDAMPCGSDMQPSNMKEELCEMIMLTLTQQKELQSLYQTVKRQNETIKNLARPRTEEHRPLAEPEEERLAMCSPQASHNTQPLKVAQRCNPEGSSIDVIKLPVSGRKSDPIPTTQDKPVDPVTFKDSILKMFGSQKQKNNPEKPMSATTKTVANTLLPGANVAKQRPASARESSPTTNNNKTVFVKGPPVMIWSEGACNVDVQSTEFDPERSGFVLVNKREREMRICPLCSKKFPSGGASEMEQFMQHVNGCVPPDDYRQCPMCLERFDKKFSDYEFEVHVNEHFDEDRLMCLSPLDKNK